MIGPVVSILLVVDRRWVRDRPHPPHVRAEIFLQEHGPVDLDSAQLQAGHDVRPHGIVDQQGPDLPAGHVRCASGIVSTWPGKIQFPSAASPCCRAHSSINGRLAWKRAGQPPLTSYRRAIWDRVSPGTTVWVVGLADTTGGVFGVAGGSRCGDDLGWTGAASGFTHFGTDR